MNQRQQSLGLFSATQVSSLMLFSSCTGCKQRESEIIAHQPIPQQQVTKLTYTINLRQGPDGHYKAKKGEKITITATATGPAKDTVKWAINAHALSGSLVTTGDEINKSSKSNFINNIGTTKAFSVDVNCDLKVQCIPIPSNTQQRKQLVTGTKIFLIKVE